MKRTTMTTQIKQLGWWSAVLALAFSTVLLPTRAAAQEPDQQDDPPTRVARLGFMEGSVSFEPAGESDWVQAVPNRPMTTGDRLWTDQHSRAELQLGSSVIRLRENTGFSFLNLDDHTVQIQLTSGAINVRVRRLDQSYDYFEVDTPNLAFTVSRPGSYRIEATDDGAYTVVAVRDGGGEATGNGQTYTLYSGQRGSFNGTDSLYANVEDIDRPDQFDNWAYGRDRRYDLSPSARYLSREVVGFEDLDEYGEWRDDWNYGHVWFPNRVEAGWAPYHTGHWAWISPWGYTWVDDSPWGYAPFHYGRWMVIGGRWGWVPGPVDVRPVYAPALVVFIGGGMGFGGNMAWFPLGPREVYVPSYRVSRGYMNQINISNTTVNTTVITNVYNTTIINRSTTITNVTYANRNVQGAVMAVPQTAFASAQPVARAAVAVTSQQIASASVSTAAAVVPTRQSVLGSNASTAGHVSAPPAVTMNRQVVANRTPPPPPVPFAQKQQALAAHPGQPLSKQEMQTLRPAAAAPPMVKQAPPGKPAAPTTGHPMNQPGNQPNAARPAQPTPPPANQPMNRPPNPPAPNERMNNERPMSPPQPNRPAPPPPQQNNRPVEPQPQNNRPPAAQPNNRPVEPQPQNNRPPAAQPNNRPEPTRPENNQPQPNRNQPAPHPQTPPPDERPQKRTPPPAAEKPAAPPQKQQPKPQTPAEKKQEEERQKREQQKPPGE